ncbi:MAG TPA: sulfatase [Planctomycetaceae bacterium]|nr:sulfatase [Planctomycetaceae bacterium]
MTETVSGAFAGLRSALPCALAAVAVFGAVGVPSAFAAERPNIVLIISDDQRWTDFGFMGHDVIRTPHLDQLAARSAVFPRGYVPTSLCRPSLVTMITGLYPHQHKVTGNDPPRGTDRGAMLRHIRRLPTLPKRLGEAGYLSHQSGKWWEGGYELGGFTAGMTHGDPARGGRHGDEGLKIGRQGMQPMFDFIEGCGERPFFVWYAPFLPHTPHNPPPRLLQKYTAPGRPLELARYFAMCEWFDETCGELLSFLDESGKAENTLVVFVTDNGWIQPTPLTELPDGWRHPFAPKSKRSPYDGGVRTPIMLAWPGRIEPGRHETLVSSIDLAPTILAASGVQPPDGLPGLNLLDVLAAGGRTEREALFGEIYEHDVVDIDAPARGLLFRWCIEGNWKLIVPAGESAAVELYDLGADPHEEANVAARHADVAARLRNRLESWWPVNPAQ